MHYSNDSAREQQHLTRESKAEKNDRKKENVQNKSLTQAPTHSQKITHTVNEANEMKNCCYISISIPKAKWAKQQQQHQPWTANWEKENWYAEIDQNRKR